MVDPVSLELLSDAVALVTADDYRKLQVENLRLTRELDEAKRDANDLTVMLSENRKLVRDAEARLEQHQGYAKQMFAELESRLAWHKVSDRLPDEDRYVLVHIGTECPETAWYDGVFWGMEEDDTETHELTAVTHWREIGPLPAAPNEAGTGEGE